MTIEEIRKGAPEFASHYYIVNDRIVIYYRYIGGELWVKVFGDWMLSEFQNRKVKPLSEV